MLSARGGHRASDRVAPRAWDWGGLRLRCQTNPGFHVPAVHARKRRCKRREPCILNWNRRHENQVAGVAPAFENIVIAEDSFRLHAVFGKNSGQPHAGLFQKRRSALANISDRDAGINLAGRARFDIAAPRQNFHQIPHAQSPVTTRAAPRISSSSGAGSQNPITISTPASTSMGTSRHGRSPRSGG
jgi:hypothetical protein